MDSAEIEKVPRTGSKQRPRSCGAYRCDFTTITCHQLGRHRGALAFWEVRRGLKAAASLADICRDSCRPAASALTTLYCTPTYGDARTVASRLGPSAAQAAAQTAVMYTHSTHSPKGPLACMVGSVRLTAPVSKLARRKTPSRWRFNAPKRSGAGAGQTRLVARQMHSTKRVCGEQAQRLGARACSWARALCAPARRPRASRPGCTAVATPAAPRHRQGMTLRTAGGKVGPTQA